MQDLSVVSVAHVIQLSVAPVFLLVAMGGILGSIANRQARISDRMRALHIQLYEEMGGGSVLNQPHDDPELKKLFLRSKMIGWSMALCTSTGLLVAIMFLGATFSIDTTVIISALFVMSMLALIGGLMLFMSEVLLALPKKIDDLSDKYHMSRSKS